LFITDESRYVFFCNGIR